MGHITAGVFILCFVTVLYYYNDPITTQLSKLGDILYTRQSFVQQSKIDSGKVPLLTIFTTFVDNPDKFYIHRNVILNWANFGPKVQPLLFANLSGGSQLLVLAKHAGWWVHPIQESNSYGTPFLKVMYRVARQLTNSTFYGFCNGDILFDDGLVRTLEGVSTYLQNSTLVIGKRRNVNVTRHGTRPIFLSHNITTAAKQKGYLFTRFAEDFFFIGKPQLFPWHTIKDVVIGRVAYDNYLVSQAIRGDVLVIDATNTLVAMHQTGKDGNTAGNSRKGTSYNKRIIGNYNYTGATSDAEYITTSDDQGRVLLERRVANALPKRCKNGCP